MVGKSELIFFKWYSFRVKFGTDFDCKKHKDKTFIYKITSVYMLIDIHSLNHVNLYISMT